MADVTRVTVISFCFSLPPLTAIRRMFLTTTRLPLKRRGVYPALIFPCKMPAIFAARRPNFLILGVNDVFHIDI